MLASNRHGDYKLIPLEMENPNPIYYLGSIPFIRICKIVLFKESADKLNINFPGKYLLNLFQYLTIC